MIGLKDFKKNIEKLEILLNNNNNKYDTKTDK